MICWVLISSFLSILLPTKYMKDNAKVDVPNFDAPKVRGCHLVVFHVLQLLTIRLRQHNFVSFANQLRGINQYWI